MSHILIVDDEENIVALVTHYLSREGFETRAAYDGPAGLAAFRATTPSLLILDLMLPGLPGTELCREVRRTSDVPILMLTARDDIVDKVVGFELGADDYLTKPFLPQELVARVKALYRRAARAAAPATDETAALRFATLTVDPARREVLTRGHAVELRPKEFDLLLMLARHPGQVFSREQLLSKVWGYDFEGQSRTVDVHVQHVREKIEAAGGSPGLIATVWGVGYKFEDVP
jgi:two-component system response regulator ResD